MKTKTIVWLSLLLLLVNVGLGLTIYLLLNPETKIPLPKLEYTEVEVGDLKSTVKTKLYERVQLVGAEGISEETVEDSETSEEHVVDEWELTFRLPSAVEQFNISLHKDLLTIERHLQVLAYIARYDAGVPPAIDGQWELLATYNGSDYYVRKGTSVVEEEFDEQLDAERDAVYMEILKTYRFMQE